MIYSMTGFGQAQAEKNGERLIVTLKSVNHRYFETAFHFPVGLDYLESLFRNKIQDKIKRGRINISLSHVNESREAVILNQELVREYHRVLENMRKKLKLSGEVGITALVSLPGVLSSKKQELGASERESLVRLALNEALKKLVDMRRKEGEALAVDLASRIRRIAKHMETIKKVVKKTFKVNKAAMPPEAFESFLRSTDVCEEMTRIDFHLKSFTRHMRLKDPKGKVLDFIGQELQREINTLGAKVQDKHVAYQVVMVKDQIEKIREQVQNVE